MPVIVDANVAMLTFIDNCPDFLPIITQLKSGKLILAYGGKLTKEYEKLPKVLKIFAALDRAGKAKKSPDVDVDLEVVVVKAMKACKSNDEHIIALARVSKSRVLCTKDKLLIEDFTNVGLISAPKGKVYKSPAHSHLLRSCRK